MSRRIALATLLALVLVPLAAGSASAGGSVFDFDDGEGSRVPDGGFVLPGDVITAHTTFSPQISGLGGIQDGPFDAYLLRGARYVSPGHIPASAIRLGQLEILRREFDTFARITFTVPSVPTGDYTLSLCNDPCTESSLGDITGGWLRIARTAKEGRLIARLEDVRRDRSRLTHQLTVSDERLQAAMDEANDTTGKLQARVDELEAQLRASREAAAARDRLLIDDGPALAIAAGLALLAVVTALALRRSRRPPAIHPTPEPRRAAGGNGAGELSPPREPRSREPVGPRR